MDLARDIAMILSALGAGLFVPKLVSAGIAAVTGRPVRQRREIDRAYADRDEEAQKRRIAEEHASRMRRLAIEAPCIAPESIPDWPLYHRKKESSDEESS